MKALRTIQNMCQRGRLPVALYSAEGTVPNGTLIGACIKELLMSIDLTKMPKLGFGLMRLPEANGKIDMDEVCRMVDLYMEAGLTYFDTAYVYHGGKSEVVAKEAIVQRYPRESFTLATKLPAWEMKEESDRDRIFNEQLERAGVDSVTRER